MLYWCMARFDKYAWCGFRFATAAAAAETLSTSIEKSRHSFVRLSFLSNGRGWRKGRREKWGETRVVKNEKERPKTI